MPLYYRPEVQVEALYLESEGVYVVNGLREQQVKLFEEEFEGDYIKIDGRSRKRRRPRKYYRTSEEAPRLVEPPRFISTNPPQEEQLPLLNGATVPEPHEPPAVEAPEEN